MGFNAAHVRRIEFPNLQNAKPARAVTRGDVRNRFVLHTLVELQVHTKVGLNFKNNSRCFSIQSYKRPKPWGQVILGLQPSSAWARRMSLIKTFWSPGLQSALPGVSLAPLRWSINASNWRSDTTLLTPPPILKARPAALSGRAKAAS